jgi:hypothetical protein
VLTVIGVGGGRVGREGGCTDGGKMPVGATSGNA